MFSLSAHCGLVAQRRLVPSAASTRMLVEVQQQSPSWSPLASSSHPQDQQVRFRSNRSRRGLYDGKDIRSGNTLSFSMKANKRKFKPNVIKKRVYSEILDEMIPFHVTTAALRSIDKAGGLDNYLLKSKHVTEGEGLAAKKRVKNAIKFAEKRARRDAEQNNNTSTSTTAQEQDVSLS
ncbi:protein L28 [Seminavis robusta]|uniref:Large ribosomal subunit protein bL28m n=1 Tax=Seminavis robusta TaxID=568900 RepID=A0A9N8HNW8_9STRA|nr:protein L28 [Seminavis robusta]|eukprot:Sro1124_g243770.1 protein L28 (178) ;mRNA; f:8249-8782